MKIFYQGNKGSYMHIASLEVAKNLSEDIEAYIGKNEFSQVWDAIGEDENHIGVLAIENSYMGSIHPNMYGFLEHDYTIIGSYEFEINHCLCSHETNISDIKKVYSQLPALQQCTQYLSNKDIVAESYIDTSLSAKKISESLESGAGAICSEMAAEIYGLNILDRSIQDQKGNTTRFLVLSQNKKTLQYTKKTGKTSLLFEAPNIPASLHKCLGCFADHDVNLSKIESLPAYGKRFEYLFWIDIEGSIEDAHIQDAIENLKQLTHNIRILGSY